MAELQTAAAAIDLAVLAVKICKFLKKVKDADIIAKQIHDKVERLGDVLDGVDDVLEQRAEKGGLSKDQSELKATTRISESIEACGNTLKQIEEKIRGSANQAQPPELGLGRRFKVAFQSRSIGRLQGEVEAHINILSLNLNILQVYDQNALRNQVGEQHEETLGALAKLNLQTRAATQSRDGLRAQQSRAASVHPEAVAGEGGLDGIPEPVDARTMKWLAESIGLAETVYDRMSEYESDVRSQQDRRSLVGAPREVSPFTSPPPEPETKIDQPISFFPGTLQPSALLSDDEDNDEDESEVPPLRILNKYISDYRVRSRVENSKGHFNQAELCLGESIKYSEMREKEYGVIFGDRHELHEELVLIHQRSGKWAEALQKAHHLRRESTTSSSDTTSRLLQARHNDLLASVHWTKFQSSAPEGQRGSQEDLENADKYAHIAFKKRDSVLENGDTEIPDEAEERNRQRLCMQLLVSVLEARDKTVEANVYKEMLQDASAGVTESSGRLSVTTSRHETEYEVVEDSQGLILEAVKSGNSDQIENLLATTDLDIEKFSVDEKTALLLNAVERGDETTVHKLLGTANGADVDGRGKKGLTALHVAAAEGNEAMLHCLSKHDANINVKDNVGETPLLKAIHRRHGGAVRMLHDLDADFQIRYEDEWSILHHSVRHSTPEMTRLLLDLAPTNLKDSADRRGMTPLHHCAEQVDVRQAKALLERSAKADLNILDPASRTALFFVAQGPDTPQRTAMVDLFVTHGAIPSIGRWHPKFDDYAVLRPYSARRRQSKLSRHDSISTEGTVDSTVTQGSRLSMLSRRLGRK